MLVAATGLFTFRNGLDQIGRFRSTAHRLMLKGTSLLQQTINCTQ
jgi:hypothetical protein